MDDLETSNKTSLKIWITTLAISVFFVAMTFAILAGYLAEIKANTQASREDMELLSQRINSLDMEIASLHRHMMAQQTPPAANTAVPSPPEAPAPGTPAAPVSNMAPAPAGDNGSVIIHPPSISTPKAAPVPETPPTAPGSAPSPAKP
jgi:hypothetical protein